MSNTQQTNANQPPTLLFVCAGNTCRSLMAEALAHRRFGDSVRVSSAGLSPQQAADAKNAIDTLKFEFGLDFSGHVPRNVRALDLEAFDLVVAMDKTIAGSSKPAQSVTLSFGRSTIPGVTISLNTNDVPSGLCTSFVSCLFRVSQPDNA